MEPIRADEIRGMWSYLQQIDWSEPWFWSLGFFHLVCVIITVSTRNSSTLQSLHFVVMLLMVYFAETLNEWAANNWRLFARQQYFDSNGLFISVVFSTPVLVNCLVIVILWLRDMSSMLSETRLLKRARQAEETRKKTESEETNKKKESEEIKKEK